MHEILEKLDKMKNKNHKDADCLCVVVLTHGSDGYLWARDKSYEVKQLWEPFTANNCPTLAEKPKTFIIQVRFSNFYMYLSIKKNGKVLMYLDLIIKRQILFVILSLDSQIILKIEQNFVYT